MFKRRYLIKNNDWQKSIVHWIRVVQGCLANGINTVLIYTSGEAASMIVKNVGTIACSEYEFPLTQDAATNLLKMCPEKIEKFRYLVSFGGKEWNIDTFVGRRKGLTVAEINLKTENEWLELPSWIGEDITEDSRYSDENIIVDISDDDIANLIANKHSCNRHTDCMKADAAAIKLGYKTPYHCHDPGCEECFPL